MARILIVDDDPDIVEACQMLLEQKGHEVSSAGSRDEGLKAIQASVPDLLILDVMMEQPDDGFVLAQELRRAGFQKPILMLTNVGHVTGIAFDKDEEMVPVDEFYEKPITPTHLVEVVTRLLSIEE